MATHKVPQDVEAEDHVLGFLSMKQLIFTIIGLAFGWLTFWFFTKVHPIASIIWVPFCLIFLVLGLYRRADQPVEVYLMAALRYYLAPRKKIWDQEGYDERVMITAPPKVERALTKSFTGQEAMSRLQNLSRLMDSRGWASRNTDWQNAGIATVALSTDRVVSLDAVAPQQIDIDSLTQPQDIQEDPINTKRLQDQIDRTEAQTRSQAIATLRTAQDNNRDDTNNTSYKIPEKRLNTIHQKVIMPTDEKPVVDTQKLVTERPPRVQSAHKAESARPQIVSPETKAPKPKPSLHAEQFEDGSEIKLH